LAPLSCPGPDLGDAGIRASADRVGVLEKWARGLCLNGADAGHTRALGVYQEETHKMFAALRT
jgi:hypothetical protein